MQITYLPHQLSALERLRESKGRQLLNLIPGAGKTLTAITYLKEVKAKNVLILNMATALSVWVDEAEKWDAPRVVKFQGTKVKRDKILKEFVGGWVVTSYETFLREHKNLAKFQWDATVLDECQKTKNPTAKVSKAARAFAQKCNIRILLSGTPLKNHWGDLWNPVETICPNSLFGNWYVFRNMYAVMPLPGIPVIKSWRNVEEIQKKIKPHIFTIDENEIRKNIPPMTMIDIRVELSPAEKKQYSKIRDEMLMEISGEDVSIVNALAQLTKLRQCANGLVAFSEPMSSKLDAIKELLEMLEGEKVIIFTEYATFATFLGQQLKCPVIQGSVSMDQRHYILESWKKDGTVLVGTSAMSASLNLQDAHYLIQYDLCWSKADEDQRIGRVWRQNQKSPVTVYNIMAEGTVDWMIRKAIKTKGSMMAQLAECTIKEII